jgi:hypothetical protein
LGRSSDALSPVKDVELSYDGGKARIPLVPFSDQWTYDVNTDLILDCAYAVVVHILELAGNTNVVEIPVTHLGLIVNHGPPRIKLTPELFIWQSDSLPNMTDH